MRSMMLKLGGKEYELVASWKASMAIEERILDPLEIARDAMLSAKFDEHNIPYEPKFVFSMKNTAMILYCALRSSGHDQFELDDVGEAMVQDGIVEHVANADQFLSLIVGAGSNEVEGGKATSGKS